MFYPPLPALLDGLIDTFLDSDPDNDRMRTHASVLLGYLCAGILALKERSFAAKLRYEHRQYHLDCCSGMSTGTWPFARHEVEIREKLRQGTWQLQDCSASRNNEDLFGPARIAGLRALQAKYLDPSVAGLEPYPEKSSKRREIWG